MFFLWKNLNHVEIYFFLLQIFQTQFLYCSNYGTGHKRTRTNEISGRILIKSQPKQGNLLGNLANKWTTNINTSGVQQIISDASELSSAQLGSSSSWSFFRLGSAREIFEPACYTNLGSYEPKLTL